MTSVNSTAAVVNVVFGGVDDRGATTSRCVCPWVGVVCGAHSQWQPCAYVASFSVFYYVTNVPTINWTRTITASSGPGRRLAALSAEVEVVFWSTERYQRSLSVAITATNALGSSSASQVVAVDMPCKTGFGTVDAERTECVLCSAGYAAIDEQCTACAAGQYVWRCVAVAVAVTMVVALAEM